MANKQDFIVKNGLTVLSTDTSTGTTTGAIITPGGAGIGGALNIGGSATIAGGLIVGGVDFLNYDPNTWFVSDSTGASDSNDGHRTASAFKTIKHALSVAQPGDTVFIDPGTYTETFPLTIPAGVSVRGAGLRETIVQPTVGTNQNDAFLLNGETAISDFTITGFFKPGYAFRYANGAKITNKSAYVERFSVITKGSTTTASDPYGFASNDAGNGVLIDAAVLDPTSLEPAMLFNETTFIVPNATGMYMTNGARSELVNSFFYFADKAVYAQAGTTGFAGAGKVKLRLGGTVGTFASGDVLRYYSSTGTLITTATISSVSGEYVYIDGPVWGFKNNTDAGTSTQAIFVSGGATATSILLADYHQFGAELRCIGSAAVFGNQGVIADGTGTDLKLIAFNMSHIGAGGDLSDDTSKTIQANEVIQTNNGRVYYQTVDQSGDFRVGDAFYINQRTGDVSFGTATVALSELANLTITDGVNSTTLLPQSITVGNLTFAGGSITSSAGDIIVDPAGTRVLINSDTTVQGSFTVTGNVSIAGSISGVSITGAAGYTDSTLTAGASTTASWWVKVLQFSLPNIGDSTTFKVKTNAKVFGNTTYSDNSDGDYAYITYAKTGAAAVTGSFVFYNDNSGQANSVSNSNHNLTYNATTGYFEYWRKATIAGGRVFARIEEQLPASGVFQSVIPTLVTTSTWQLSPPQLGSTATVSAPNFIQYGTITSTGAVAFGSTLSATGNSTLTSSTSSNVQVNIGSGGQYSGSTKGINIGTGGLAGSISTVTIGSSTSGALDRLVINSSQTSILGITSATSTQTGALVVTGGAGFGGDVYIGGNTYLQGDLYVDGDQFQLNSTNLNIGDKTITLSSATSNGALAANSGIQIGAGGAWASFLFNGTAAWISKGSLVASTATYNLGSLTVPWNTLYANTVYDNSNRVITTVVPSVGSGISVTNTQTIGPAASFTINNTGVLSLTGGTDTSVSVSTGNITVWNTATLQTVTGRGATTPSAISITNSTSATSTNSGALQVVGGVGIGGAVYAGGVIYSNGALVWTTATLTDNGQLTNGAGYLTSSTIGLYGVSRIDAGVGISVNRNTGTVTVTNIGVVSLKGSGYIALSAASGTDVTIYNLGVTNITTGSGISVSTSTGTVNIASVDTLQLVTARGATTNQPIAITATNVSASTSTGQALAVSGGIGALRVTASEVFDNGTRVLTSILPVGGTAISISGISTNGPQYTFTINNRGVTEAVGSTYISVSTSTGSVIISNLGLQTLTAGTDTAVSSSTGTVTVWSTGTLASITSRGATTPSAITITNTSNSTSTSTGALQVAGGVGIAGDGFVQGNFTIIGQLNANVVLGSISTASNIQGGTVGAIPYQFAIGKTGYITPGTTGTILQSNGTTASFVTTASIVVGAAQIAQTSTNVVGGLVNATTGRFSGITTVTNATASSSTTTGALQVLGGAGIVGAVYAGQLYDNNNRVVTSVVPTGGDSIGIASLTSIGTATSFTINNLGVTATIGTTYLGVSTATGRVILTNLGVQSLVGTTYLGVSSSTGTVTLTNLGVQTLTAGTDTAVSASTGTITVWDISTFQSVSDRGNETTNAISIANATGSSTSTQGALKVAGGVGIGENLNVGNQLRVYGPATFSSQVTFSGTATYVFSTNTYYTDNLIELHTTATGVNSEWTLDDGKDIGFRFHYWNRGLVTGTNAALVLASDTQWLEWYSSGAEGVYAFTSATYGGFKTGSIALVNNTVSNSTSSGALVVAGGVGIGGALNVGGVIQSNGSNVITAATLGNYGVSQILAGQAIAVSPTTGTGTVTISNLGVRSITTGSGISINTSTGTVIIQSIDTFQLVTARGATSDQSISITNATASTSTNTGALKITGGLGVGGAGVFGSGLTVGAASTFTGGIDGTITTASNITGGATGSIPIQSALGRTQFLGIGTVGYIIQSDGTNPGYVSTQTLQVGYAVRANTATNIAGGTAGQLAYQSSVGTTAFTGGTGSAGNILVSNGTSAPGFSNTLTLAGTTAASSTNTGALQVVGGVGIGGSLYVGGTAYIGGSQVVTAQNLGLFGVAQIVAGTAIGVSPTSGTGTVTISNLGVTSLTTGSGITISTSTGSITIASIDNLQLVTARGNTTNQQVYFTATNLSSSTSTGQAMMVSGGIGALAVYATNLFDSGVRVITSITPVAGTGISVTNVSTSNANMSFQVNNTGVLSVAGSAYLSASASTGAITLYNQGVQTLTAGTDTAVSASTGTITVWSTATLQSITGRGNSTTNAIYIANATSATTTTNGALTVAGGVGVLGDIYARNIYTNGQIVGGQTSTSTNLAGGNTGDIIYQIAPGLTGFIGIGTSGQILYSNGTTATWTASGALLAGVAVTATNISGGLAGWIPIQSRNSTTSFISSGTVGQLLQMGTNTATWVSTSTLQVGSAIYANTATEVAGGTAGQLLYQSGVGVTDYVVLGNAGDVLVSNGSSAPTYSNTLTLTNTVQATSTNTGALQVRGGVGIGGNVWIGGTLYASIDGSISTATNIAGGTAGAILYQNAVGKTSYIGIGLNGSVLYSNGSTATYISTTTLVVGAADSAASSRNLTGGSLGSIAYQTAVNATGFISIGSSGALLQSNGTTATFASTLTIMVAYSSTATNAANITAGTAGDLLYQSAAGTTSKLGIGTAGQVLQSTGSLPQWVSTGSTLVGTAQNINGGALGYIPYQTGAGATNFIGTGTSGSLLQMGSANTASFVLASTVTVGNATRATSSTYVQYVVGGTAGQLHYQTGVSTTDFVGTGTQGSVLVSRPGVPAFENTLSLAGSTQSLSTTSGALVVNGGVGIGGNLYVGGTLYASIDGSISTATNVAGGTAGAILYQSAVGATAKLAIGVAGTILASNGSIPAYVSTTTLLVGDSLRAVSVNNLTGGAAGSIPIQSAAGTTAYIPIGPAGYLFQSQGTTATWISTGTLVAGTALAAYNVAGGLANQVPYQTGPTATTFSSNFTFNGTSLAIGGAVLGAQFVPTNATIATSGIYGTTSTGIGVATNSVNRMFFDTAGNIGVGNNTTPTATLDISGGVKVSGIFTATNTTDATVASGVGAIDVDGGIYVAKSVVIAGATAASSTITGALLVANGGVGVNGDIWARKIYSDSIDVVANAVIMATAFG